MAANANSQTTALAESGVVRDMKPVPGSWTMEPYSPPLVELDADQYRAAILDAPGEITTEYLVWAANSAQLGIIDTTDPNWLKIDGSGFIPEGSMTVEDAQGNFYNDGTNRVIVTDNGGRAISDIEAIQVKVQGTLLPLTIPSAWFTSVDANAGLVEVNQAFLDANLGGGLSQSRGDAIVGVAYFVSSSRFWWTRNDVYETRFGWNGRNQRWEPFKGTGVRDIGLLDFDGEYVLSPLPTGTSIGSYLPGVAGDPTQYAMVRIGRVPDSGSYPVAESTSPTGFSGLLVVDDDEAGEVYDFSGSTPPLAGIVGFSTGQIQWNPAFVQEFAGEHVWYSYRSFEEQADGIVAPLLDAKTGPLFVAPIPSPEDYPFIRIGTRSHLSPILVETDAELETLTLSETEVGVSLASGKLLFPPDLVAKADPTSLDFDPNYLAATVLYDGVALNQAPQPAREPVKLVDNLGNPAVAPLPPFFDLFVPEADPFGADGLGVSGMLHVLDGTGAVPTVTAQPPGVRPGGDNSLFTTTGLIREAEVRDLGAENVTIGDTFLFASIRAIEQLEVVDTELDVPEFTFKVKGGRAVVARQASPFYVGSGTGSKAKLNFNAARKVPPGDNLYFLQALLKPSRYTTKGRMYSRVRDEFTLDGNEGLYLAINGTPYQWSAATLGAGTFSAEEVSASILNDSAALSGPPNPISSDPDANVWALHGHIVVETLSAGGVIEIGWGSIPSEREFSGAAALGLLPGWRVEAGAGTWRADSGMSFGVHRSPLNRDYSEAVSDFQNRYRFTDQLLTGSNGLQAQPVLNLDYPPLQDVAGYDTNVFFRLTTAVRNGPTVTLVATYLENLIDVAYRFEEDHFLWLERDSNVVAIEQPIQALTLGQLNVLPETMLGVEPNPQGGLSVSMGGPYEALTQGSDYLLPDDGAAGYALLVEEIAGLIGMGSRGSWVEGTTTFFNDFQAGQANFTALGVTKGDLLKIPSGDSEGWYTVSMTPTVPDDLDVTPTFLADSGDRLASWEVYDGYPDDVYDPSILADVQFVDFNHLPEEVFHIRRLSPLGTIPKTPVAQEADRLQAVVTDALLSNRPIAIRYTLTGTNPDNLASLTPLPDSELGTIANDSLYVPGAVPRSPFNLRFTDEAFAILVGDTRFEHGVDLTGVTQFSNPFPANEIEYLTTTGELKFGSQVLTDYDQSLVYWVGEFLDPTLLAAQTVEYDPSTGYLNISEADMLAHPSEEVYFVEQMVTEQRTDVAFSPMASSFAFLRPNRDRQIVEVDFLEADPAGHKKLDDEGNPIEVRGLLPVFVKGEQATRVDSKTYSFNPVDTDGFRRTVFEAVEPTVWVDDFIQNFGTEDMTIDFEANELHFLVDLEATSAVRISYAVVNAFGGEKAYSSGTYPAYRPPFFLEEGQDVFVLETDRTGDIRNGMLMRLGGNPFYIKWVVYDSATDQTTVTVFPTPITEVGSRAPGNDVLTLLTDRPVATEVDGVPVLDAPAGFLMLVEVDWEPVDRGQTTIDFQGDVTQFAVPGHLLDLGGEPHIISDAQISEDGQVTTVQVTSPFTTGFAMEEEHEVKLSVRPMYPPMPRQFLGLGAFVESEEFELILLGELNEEGNELPGRSLILGIEYTVDSDTGNVTLLEPIQAPLMPNQKLLFRHTRLDTLKPGFLKGRLSLPRYSTLYRYNTVPSTANGLLGGVLEASYSFYSPDSFYCRILPMEEYAPEVAQAVAGTLSALQAGQGPTVTTGAEVEQEQGLESLTTQRSDLTDTDRGARSFLTYYNQVVETFEQVIEAIRGDVIGDRHGKFRFFVGRDKLYTPPGYEDSITGLLNARNLWSEVFQEAASYLTPPFESPILEDDPLLNPLFATVLLAKLEGIPGTPWMMDPVVLDILAERQKILISNDIDDRVIVGLARPEFRWDPILGPVFRPKGDFDRMASPHPLSRLFPERTRAFFLSYPGLKSNPALRDPVNNSIERKVWAGNYSFLTEMERPTFSWEQGLTPPTFASTFQTEIGAISNPVLGTIDQIRNIFLDKRRPRARVWNYYPDGIEQDQFGTGFPAADITRPAAVLTPLLIADFPVDPETGGPDMSRFIANSGDLEDLTTGDAALRTPAWSDFPDPVMLLKGIPDGQTFILGYRGGSATGAGGSVRRSGVFLDTVQDGVIITFKSLTKLGDDIPINDAADILVLDDFETGGEMTLERGDTLAAMSPSLMPVEMDEPPTNEQLNLLKASSPNYRRGFDVGIRRKAGVLRDLSLPGGDDDIPFDLQRLFAQNTPLPMSELEGFVEFANGDVSPLQIPALLGETKDDTGDWQIPYLTLGNTEKDRFQEIQIGISKVIGTMSADGTQYVYPNEVRGADGAIDTVGGALQVPATLVTGVNYQPTGVGTGFVDEYDLLLMEYGSPAALPQASQGWLSVGRIQADPLSTDSLVEPPRFVTQTAQGDAIRYTMDNAIVHIVTPPPTAPFTMVNTSGCQITVDKSAGVGNPGISTFAMDSIGQLRLDDGAGGAGVGGLNDLFVNTNVITLELWAREAIGPVVPGDIVLTITFDASGGGTVTGPDGVVVPVTVIFGTGVADKSIQVTGYNVGTEFFDLPAHPEMPSTDTGGGVWVTDYAYDLRIHLDTYTAGTGASVTGYISSDRLTFNDVVDLRTSFERGAVHPVGGQSVQLELIVYECLTESDPASTINRDINGAGPVPLTFLTRADDYLEPWLQGTSDNGIGIWVDATGVGAGDELGAIRVMAFEGYGDTPIVDSDLRFSLIPSSNKDEIGTPDPNGEICEGTALVRDTLQSIFWEVTPSLGAVSKIQHGDVVEVLSGSTVAGTIKAGTYLVRHAVEENTGPVVVLPRPVRALTLLTVASATGWADMRFPKIANTTDGADPAINDTADTVRLTDIYDTELTGVSPTGNAFAAPGGTDHYIYFVTTNDGADSFTVRALYTAIETNPVSPNYRKVTLDNTSFEDETGAGISAATFYAALSEGMAVSGMVYFKVLVADEQSLPENNAVGHNAQIAPAPQPWCIYGFGGITISTEDPIPATTLTYEFEADVNEIEDISASAPATDHVYVQESPVTASSLFVTPEETTVFDNVADLLDLSGFDQAVGGPVWTALRNNAGVMCLLPNDRFTTEHSAWASGVGADVGSNGFWATSGIFIEPSFSLMAQDLGANAAGDQRLVDQLTVAVGAASIGFRFDGNDEVVDIQVRRIRRFHDVSTELEGSLTPLRFAYETRRGDVTAYAPTTKQKGELEATGATQLGPFDDPDVNINGGDIFRLIDPTGALVETIEVAGVMSATKLLLRRPGLTDPGFLANPSLYSFEVYLRKPPVPHEQSNEQLLDLVTDEILHETKPDYVNQTGGYVPLPPTPADWADNANHLYDDSLAVTFPELGIQEGDIVLVDSAGEVRGSTGVASPEESGIRPFGDKGIEERASGTIPNGVTGDPVYDPGAPNPVDDNRGYYRVDEVESDHLVLTAGYTGDYAGNLGGDIKFPDNAVLQQDLGYVVYPTIHNSVVGPSNEEGQMDLRPTQLAGFDNASVFNPALPNSFRVSDYSIRPFGYRVLRPTTLFSEESIDLVLMIRERMLSLIEHLQGAMEGDKAGDYYVFQDDLHARDIGTPTDPESGLGVYHNALLLDLLGRVDVYRFASDSDALSVVDRRFWIRDEQLDELTPALDGISMRLVAGSGQEAYTSYNDTTSATPGGAVRPVLPDLIDITLNVSDRFRDLRFAWVKYRTNRTEGTLTQIDRFDEELPDVIKEQEEFLLLKKAELFG